MAGLCYQRLSEDGFSESGAGYLDLDVAGRETDRTYSSLGIRATRLVRAGGVNIMPRMGISWRHSLDGGGPEMDAAFTGYGSEPFTVNGADLPGDTAVLEAGFTASAGGGFSLFADCHLAYADDYTSQTVSAGLVMSF